MRGIESLLSHLDRCRQTKADQWIACCPAHEDASPSLSIKLSDTGKVLIYCHAGCDVDDVLRAVGMRLSDLFPTSYRRVTTKKRPPKPTLYDHYVMAMASADRDAGMELTIEDQIIELISFMKVGNWERYKSEIL